MKTGFLERLRDPPKRYRPIAFWSWNEKLDPTETRRQIGEMNRVGIGGYFMHARGGLQTDYLGESWMANIKAGMDEGLKCGMSAWAYDENGWPSGFGDGRVNGRGERYQQKYLRYEEVAAEAARADGRTVANLRLADGRLLHFYYDVNPYYVDTLDAEVIRAFLDEVYERYARTLGDQLGRTMAGFFTDEPQVSRNGIPWSFVLPPRYEETYGEQLLPRLGELFFPVGAYRRTRYRFWHLVQELFVAAYTRQIFDWCNAHGCQLTGHMVLEETLLSQVTSNGAVMPHYEFFHIPGIDWLGRHINPPTTPVQVASVAHQLGLRQVLSETFALTGWNVSFEDLKWLFDWQMVRGVTQLCQHLQGYSLRGIRKRDYPPSLFYQQPWWDQYGGFNAAVSRIGMLLAEGDPRFEVLVLHPQASAWLHFDNAANPGLRELFEPFLALTNALEAAHVLFHYGDERILRRHGRTRGARLLVGKQSYLAVLVPRCDTLAAETVTLLHRYATKGGQLIWCGRQPTTVEGADAAELGALTSLGLRVDTPGAAVAALPPAVRRVSVTDADGHEIAAISATWRRLTARTAGEPCRFYYFTNADATADHEAEIRVPGAVAVQLGLEDGLLRAMPCAPAGDRVRVRHRFPRRGSLALLVSDRPHGLAHGLGPGPEPPLSETFLPRELFDGAWRLEMMDPNALTLDYCDFWFDGVLQAQHEHVSVIQRRALDLERPVQVRLRFEVQLAPDFEPVGEVFLVVETPERFTIQVNGAPVASRDCGAYRDTSFRLVDIRGRLRPGSNEVVLTTDFHQPREVYENLRRAKVFESEKNKLTYDSEIEAVYLIGRFGVATPGTFTPLPREACRYHGPFVIGPAPDRVFAGDLTAQGLPFYAGTVRLVRDLALSPGQCGCSRFGIATKMACFASLRVNGQRLRSWYWRPYEADLAGALVPGTNRFEIELVSGLRNLLGPHHLLEGESYGVGPGAFFKEPNIWGSSPWSDDYCFTEFGVRL